MILQDTLLRDWALSGGVVPYDPDCVNPASIDLKLGCDFIDLYTKEDIRSSELLLEPRSLTSDVAKFLGMDIHTLVLATTLETIHIPDCCAAMLKLKTTPTREGLGHPIADWVDPGFTGQLTLMLHAFKPYMLRAGERIVQLVVVRLEGDCDISYSKIGHYNGQTGPTMSWRISNERY